MNNLCLCVLFTQEHEPKGAKKGSKQLYLHIRHHSVCKCCNGQTHTPLALPVGKNKKKPRKPPECLETQIRSPQASNQEEKM